MAQLLSLFRRLRSAITDASDPEMAVPQAVPEAQARRSSQYQRDFREPSDDLQEFRLMVGIYQDNSLGQHRAEKRSRTTSPGRPAANLGIYAIVSDKEIKCKKNYKNCSITVNACLGLQIIFAAALTAIGASNGSRGSVTVLGAFNTMMASILTFLKGSGLPNRLRYFQHEWATLREYIEQKERDLMLGYEVDVRQEIETIRQMYEQVKRDVESNTPERFASSTGGLAATKPGSGSINDRINRISQMLEEQLGKSQRASQGTLGSIMKSFGDKRESAATWVNEEKAHVVGAAQDAVRSGQGQIEKGFRETVQGPTSSWISQRRNDMNTATNTAVNKGEHSIVHFTEGLMDVKRKLSEKLQEIHDMEKNMERQAVLAKEQGTARVSQTQAEAAQDMQAAVNAAAGEVVQVSKAAVAEAQDVVHDTSGRVARARDALEQSADQTTATTAAGFQTARTGTQGAITEEARHARAAIDSPEHAAVSRP